MKNIFLTGVTGFIGGSVACKLLAAGHHVTGLVRKKEDIPRVAALGINAIHGSIDQPAQVQRLASEAHVVINTADADHPYLVSTLLTCLKDTGKTFIQTSGSSIVGDKAAGAWHAKKQYKSLPKRPLLEKVGRVAIDREVVGSARRGIHSIVICPSMIYGEGLGLKKNSIQIPMLIEACQEPEAALVIGEGNNTWSNVHIEDLADLYVSAMEKAEAGSFFYAENGMSSLRAIAEAIRQRFGFEGPVKSISMDEAIQRWGLEAAHFALGSNSWVNSSPARAKLGWRPRKNCILKSIEEYKLVC